MITIEKARRIRELIEKLSASLEDEEALEAVELFPEWMVGVAYAVNDRVRYHKKLYKVVQAHTSQGDWLPNETPALYTEVAAPGEIPVWKQPTGAQDAYNIGDKVYYPDKNGTIYECTIDNNVWSPDAYPDGWQAVS